MHVLSDPQTKKNVNNRLWLDTEERKYKLSSLLYVHIWTSVGKALWRLLLRWQSGSSLWEESNPVSSSAAHGGVRQDTPLWAEGHFWMFEFSRSIARRACVDEFVFVYMCVCVGSRALEMFVRL